MLFHVLHLARSTRCRLRIRINRKTVNFEQQILALLLVHLTHNLSCIKYAHISQQGQGLWLSSSSIQAHRMKSSILRQMQSWFRMEKTTGAAIGYNVRVANKNFRYNLWLPWRKKKKKKFVPIYNADCFRVMIHWWQNILFTKIRKIWKTRYR